MRRTQILLALALTLALFGWANAAEAQCTANGWAFGLYIAEDDSVTYYAEGPLLIWERDGFLDPDNDFFQLDMSEWKIYDQVVVMTVRYGDGRPDDRVGLRPHVKGYCSFLGGGTPDGNYLVLGNLKSLDDHTHISVELYGHKYGQYEPMDWK